MRLKLKHITLSLSLLTLAVACKEEEAISINTPSEGKTPIELSVGGIGGQESATTRAVYTTKTPDKKFTAGTSIFMLMKSEYVALTGDFASYNYGGAQTTKYATTCGNVKDDADGKNVEFINDATTTRTRYWDDAHARSSRLSIWAVACDGRNALGGIGTSLDETKNIFNNKDAKQPWGTTAINATELAWNVPHYTMSTTGQDAESMKNRDLLFSNNVTKYTINSVETDKRTKYETSNKQFGNSELTFYHALSKITVKIKKGDGFTGTNDFKFTGTTTKKNITLQYFNIWGKFNVEQGEWTAVNDQHQAITYMYNKTGETPQTTDADKPAYELEALVLPYLSGDTKTSYQGSQFTKDDNTTVMMEFSLDNNVYKLTAGQLYTALKDNTSNTLKEDNNKILIEPGINYEFTFTVGKTKIDHISAQLVDWQTVTAEATPDNAHPLTVAMETTAGTETPVASYLYKSAVSSATTDGNDKGYSNSTRFALNADKTEQNTGWYWESNNTYYHFRTITQKDKSNNNIDLKTKEDATEANYITMTGGAVGSTVDYVWGAPIKESNNHSGTTADGHQIPYDQTKGYEAYLYPAIGPTKNNIHITQFHMMSDLEINLKTTTGNDKVDLTNATVTLNGYANTANLMVGTGLVTSWGSYITTPTTLTTATATSGFNKTFTWRVVPQVITATDTHKVSLVISTNDGNIYEIKDLSTLPVKVNGSTTDSTIPTWEPGKKYIYNLTLKKTGIDHITATVVNWVNVEATNENITIQ